LEARESFVGGFSFGLFAREEFRDDFGGLGRAIEPRDGCPVDDLVDGLFEVVLFGDVCPGVVEKFRDGGDVVATVEEDVCIGVPECVWVEVGACESGFLAQDGKSFTDSVGREVSGRGAGGEKKLGRSTSVFDDPLFDEFGDAGVDGELKPLVSLFEGASAWGNVNAVFGDAADVYEFDFDETSDSHSGGDEEKEDEAVEGVGTEGFGVETIEFTRGNCVLVTGGEFLVEWFACLFGGLDGESGVDKEDVFA